MNEHSTARRVVIAEDEALLRLDLKEMLQQAGYEVVAEAADGESAVRLAREHRPDVCIFDVNMPLLDGIAAAERVIAERIAPVLILSGFSQRELVERAAAAGVMNYLVKPFTKEELTPAVEIAISRHAQLTALENEAADASSRLETRKVVDRAKGILQTTRGMTEPVAFRWIQRTSMDRRLTMREVAESVVAGVEIPSTVTPVARIYIEDEAAKDAVQKALLEVLEAFGLVVESESEPAYGSWSRKFRLRSAKSQVMADLAMKLERAADLQSLHKEQSKVDANQAEAVARLITALEKTPSAVINVGSVLLVKVDGALAVRNLTTRELVWYERNPALFKDPANVLQKLQQFMEGEEGVAVER